MEKCFKVICNYNSANDLSSSKVSFMVLLLYVKLYSMVVNVEV